MKQIVKNAYWPQIVGAVAWLATAGLTYFIPNADDFPRTTTLAVVCLGIAILSAISLPLNKVRYYGAWILALALFIGIWEVIQAKLLLLPRPFFGAPQELLDVFITDWAKLLNSLAHSMMLLVGGYLLGCIIGFVIGVGMGWSKLFGYWAHPVLRFLGPLPPVAFLPLLFAVIPSSFVAGELLMAFAASFPVAVLTWSGIAGVNPSYYDVAKTMGAKPLFLIRHVAIPAALPFVFVGMFMALGSCFYMLVVAEMLGVKAGLGFYMQWAQGWAAYPNMYAALLIMAVMCTSFMTLLFKVRNRLLRWQKESIKW
ncbi:ABC-type nitrate/sulfonate/bicarbonate transport system [Commensalibacter communis]|uniref:ABC transporter permease n=1 Tax=Commensalibacter communis TaxID=2972786 RepID=UPI0022FFB17B|nr:ABC transporter permease subunit [Commensalibacter communis]CAI3955052.1 ABC-type nitrate/sulfonate/bicarbonate transport system [Commensalibacter communis]